MFQIDINPESDVKISTVRMIAVDSWSINPLKHINPVAEFSLQFSPPSECN